MTETVNDKNVVTQYGYHACKCFAAVFALPM